jgi:hypothetical protein
MTSFWNNAWIGETALKIQFPTILNICSIPNITVAEAFNSADWQIQYRRGLIIAEVNQPEDLWETISNIHPAEWQ